MKEKMMKRLMIVSVVGALSALLLVAGAVAPARAQNLIDVDPLNLDFGDVAVGESKTMTLTIMNIDGMELNVEDLYLAGGSTDYTVLPPAPYGISDVPGNNFVDVSVTFGPASEGLSNEVLVIESNDFITPVVEVTLVGNGTPGAQDPVEMIAAVLAFFDESVAHGTLEGNGPGNSAAGRLGAFENMLEASYDLTAGGFFADACGQLTSAYNRCDGLPRPPEFLKGTAVNNLAGMILDVMNALGCE
jgi:hypothetical protein